jgi:uncharacterized membrane protein
VDPLALGFVALAAVLHAAWNILLKTAGDPLRAATIGMTAASIAGVPLVLLAWLALDRPAVPAAAWLLGICSGLVEVAYFVFLAAAYRRGDLSVVYPLARGSAPLLAVVLGVGILGERLAAGAWLGVGLLVGGLLLVQRPWRLLGDGAGADDRAAAAFALLTGFTIAGYSAIDTVGVRYTPSWLYAGILFPVCAIGLVGTLPLRRRLTAGHAGAAAEGPLGAGPGAGRAIAGGLMMFGAYCLVLAALSRAPLATVAPLRESAVVLAAAWGLFRLGEAAGGREVSFRIAGSSLVLAGAAVLAIAH